MLNKGSSTFCMPNNSCLFFGLPRGLATLGFCPSDSASDLDLSFFSSNGGFGIIGAARSSTVSQCVSEKSKSHFSMLKRTDVNYCHGWQPSPLH